MAKEKKYPKAIYNWPEDERPRERLLKFGADKLSDTEPRPFKMYYVYLLKNIENRNIYIGWTSDLKRRYIEHKKKNSHWQLIYYEAYISKQDAQVREKQLKQYGSSLGHLKKRIINCLERAGRC
jgi:putative endonuclease